MNVLSNNGLFKFVCFDVYGCWIYEMKVCVLRYDFCMTFLFGVVVVTFGVLGFVVK